MDLSDAELLKSVAAGDTIALGSTIFEIPASTKTVCRGAIDPRISARVDASDIMQEVHVE